MAHRGVFDPTDRDLFNEQRQRFDWSLLQNGNVYRYDHAFQLDSACTRLADLGYLVHRIDADPWTSVEDMHTAFAKTMSFPSYYGRNLDALNDVLSDVARFDYGSDPASSGTVLAIAGYDTLAEMDRRTAGIVLDIFAVQARLAALYAHPMLCLVESTFTDYPAVGGRPVSFGSVWDVEPDPPAPFQDGDLVENVLQIYADEAGADKYVAELHQVLADTLTVLGRWQILDPALASERTAAFHAEHRQEPPPPEPDCGRSSLASVAPETTPSSATNSCTFSRTPECISTNSYPGSTRPEPKIARTLYETIPTSTTPTIDSPTFTGQSRASGLLPSGWRS